jgi:hypothetical protein
VRELQGQSYAWPREREPYERYRVFAGDTRRNGTVHIAIGKAERPKAWGKDRKYLIAFLSSGAPQVPLVELLEVDDFESTRELVAVIRGSDGGKKMDRPGDTLPDIYVERFRTELYLLRPRRVTAVMGQACRHRQRRRSRDMLNHALLQARRRGDLRVASSHD